MGKEKFKQKSFNKIDKKINYNSKVCFYCNHEMRVRGASDSIGSRSWKCKNKKCGRTLWERGKVIPPKPLLIISLINKYRF